MQNIFVYGTLKRGFEFSGALKDQEFLGNAHTIAEYWMFSLRTYPGLVDADGQPGDNTVSYTHLTLPTICSV